MKVLRPYEEITDALETLNLPFLISKNDIKKQYHFLVKKNHPDVGGDENVMKKINFSYKVLMKYIDNFRFSFTEEEISKQFSGAIYAEQFKP